MIKDIAFGIIISVLFVGMILLFCMLIIKLYISKIKKYNAVIYENEIEFQKTLNKSIVETQEQILTNISRELHDDAGQQLTYINLQLEMLKLDLPDLDTVLNPISDSISKLSKSVRSMSHLLNNRFIAQNNLYQSIEKELERLQISKTPEIKFIQKGKLQKVYSETEKIMIYRIFQESINNCLKHAKASKVEVSVCETPNFELRISDNGIGFLSLDHQSLGFENMRQRAKMIQHQIQIKTKPNQGTTITLTEINGDH